jgi:hypothetical protein
MRRISQSVLFVRNLRSVEFACGGSYGVLPSGSNAMIFERTPQPDRPEPQYYEHGPSRGRKAARGRFRDLPGPIQEQLGIEVAATRVVSETTSAPRSQPAGETLQPVAEEEQSAPVNRTACVTRKEISEPPARYRPGAVISYDARGKKTIEALPIGPDGVQRFRVTRDVRPEARVDPATVQPKCKDCEQDPAAEHEARAPGLVQTLQQSSVHIQREPRTETRRPQTNARQLALFAMVARWMDAGLLHETRLPQGVAPFPEFQISPEEAERWRTALLFTGVTGTKELLEKAVAAQTARTAPAAASGGGILARILLRGGLILALILPSGPLNEDEERNDLTGDFLTGFEQRWWSALSQSQKQYLMELKQREDDRTFGESRLVEETQERFEDQTAISADREREEEPTCERRDVPRRGGHREHDAYATRVTGSARDHFVYSRAAGFHVNYDGRTGPVLVWECKVRYWWWDLPKYRNLKFQVLDRFERQRRRGMAIARACGLEHKWAVQNPAVADELNEAWRSEPKVDVIR